VAWIMIELNYSKMSFDELINLIRSCQAELYMNRATTTQCYNVDNKTGRKKIILIEHKNTTQKNLK
jgi:hypothetical protein